MQAGANRPVAGIVWMIVTGMLFVGVTAVVKHVGDALPAPQAAFMRYALGLVFLLPMIRPMIAARLTRRQYGLFGARGLVHTFGVMLWFYAMTQISIAEVTAMNYLNPVYVTLGAWLFLGERLAARRILAVVAALAGALIILRPGFREIEAGHIAMLGTAMFFGISYLLAKLLTGEVSPVVIVAMLSLTVTVGLAPFAAAVWVTPTLSQAGWMFVVACLATAGHYTMTLAFAAAPVTVTQPVTFLQLLWSVILGAVFFAEPVDGWVVLGGGVILAAVSFITWREAVMKRRVLTPHVNATKT
jgi:drug/metabolite transporter (DMT)-like permease